MNGSHWPAEGNFYFQIPRDLENFLQRTANGQRFPKSKPSPSLSNLPFVSSLFFSHVPASAQAPSLTSLPRRLNFLLSPDLQEACLTKTLPMPFADSKNSAESQTKPSEVLLSEQKSPTPTLTTLRLYHPIPPQTALALS